MKIRTRLLLFLIPSILGQFALIAILIANQWISSHALLPIISLFLASATLTVFALLFIGRKISEPIQKLNNSALAIAAGHYGESAAVGGPKEIADLANTLNTMSQCLLENISRLKENSLLRERMYGEYECSMLLQHLMLQKNIDECRSDAVAVRAITQFSDDPRGLLLDFPKTDHPALFQIYLAEAEQTGFEGMYGLLTQYKHTGQLPAQTTLTLDRESQRFHFCGPHIPFTWSLKQKKPLEAPFTVESGDFFFLYNEGLARFFPDPKHLLDLLVKVLKVFAQDGLETTAAMLQKELLFATKRKDLFEDIHLLCFQVLNP